MSPQHLAPYVLRVLARHQMDGRLCTLDSLTDEIRVRRADLRRTVSALHREGYVDALRMRATMSGFAIGRRLLDVQLPELRASCEPQQVAAA
jgi:DNA-binding IscR family transcriptional regulator